MYRLIITDLDGTLLRDDHTISEYTKSVIHEASERGADLMLATGRLSGGARLVARELELNTPILVCNGALIKEAGGKVLYERPMKEETLRSVFHLLNDMGLYYHCYGEENFYTRKLLMNVFTFYDAILELPEEERFPMIEIEPMELIGKDVIYKLLTRCEDDDARKELYSRLAEIPDTSITVSLNNTFDISAAQVSKSIAIRWYAEENGIDPSEIICFGDNYNDVDMIKYAGLGVAVENGVEAIKEAADYVTGSNMDDGVAKAIEKFVLI